MPAGRADVTVARPAPLSRVQFVRIQGAYQPIKKMLEKLVADVNVSERTMRQVSAPSEKAGGVHAMQWLRH